MAVAVACSVCAQTYQVGSGASKSSEPQPGQTQSKLGWGSNIENARLARTAQLALQRGNYSLALDYAQRAAQAAPDDLHLWFLVGYAARLDGKLQLSVDAYARGLRLSPSAPDGLSGLAQDYSVMGRNADAMRLLMQLLAIDPKRGDDALLLGDLYMRSRDYSNAIDWLESAERIYPGARSELLLALCYRQLKKIDLASRYLALAEKRAPANPDVQRSMAGFYRETGRYSESIAALKSIRNPKPDVIAELAYTYQLDGKLDDSARFYEQAAIAQPRNLDMQLAAAQAQVAVGSITKANLFVERATAVDAEHYRVHRIRGEIAELQERDADAVHEYNVALARLPADPVEGALYAIQLHMDLAAMYQKLGDEGAANHEIQTAQAEINTADGTGPRREDFLRLRSLIKLNAGDPAGALADIKGALAINGLDRNNLQLNGDILMKLGRADQAIDVYKQVLAKSPDNRLALTSLGYASRATGNVQDAEKYFRRLEQVDPSSHVAYLALGDLYTAGREFTSAQVAYAKGYELAAHNALIVAGGMNAAIEAHNIPVAGAWFARVTSEMLSNPQVLREEERYLSFEGKYEESARVGQEAMKLLPNDRDVAVYLGYDLLHLERYDELLELTSKYLAILQKEPDIPLLEGYVHKHEGLSEEARQDFTETLQRDPSVVTAYVNRGYMLNDLHKPQLAATDFESALTKEPNNGEAHLGLAYADLDLGKSERAVMQSKLAEQAMGDSKDIHVVRATAYGREGALTKAANEYRAALKFSPADDTLYLGLGSTLFAMRQYREAIDQLESAERLSPDNASIYALQARSYAGLQDRDQTSRYIQLAEAHAGTMPAAMQSEIFASTGQALSALGDQRAAMERFQKALIVSDADRVGVRLAIARLMAQEGHSQEAERQIALALMEAEAGDTAPESGSQLIEAADVFRSLHEYELSQSYLERAKAAAAPDAEVRLGLADNYLALGDTVRAQAELDAINVSEGSAPQYQYLLAKANVFRQKHQNAQALTAFAQASYAQGEDQSAELGMREAGADEGLRVTPTVSLLSDLLVEPIFEDTTVYVLDSKLDATFAVPSSDPALLPPPRSSLQTQWTDAFHVHLGQLPTPSGFFQLRSAQGMISVPSTNSVVNRDTTDYTFNFGVNPTIRMGNNVLTFNSGIQGTIRRDSLSPVQMNQNLIRVFTYVSTSSFFNAVSVSGYFIREAGPFTESNLSSRALAGAVDFRVGAPWGKTALVTGWGANKEMFSPANYQDYYTASYVGIERRFSERLDAKAVVGDLRAWRVVGAKSAIAQNLRPAGIIHFAPKRNWDIQASTAFSSTRGFHVYDAMQNGVSLSYAMQFHRRFDDQSGEVTLKYPIRFSAGFQEESFFNFAGSQNQQLRPYVQVSIF
jgi:tetratricopeptide (TPR) repeat protein